VREGARVAGSAPGQGAEAKPSSRGDARAAERARTGGARSSDRKFCPDPLAVNAQRLRLGLGAANSLPGGPLYWIAEFTVVIGLS
jgi:hypothetical protein